MNYNNNYNKTNYNNKNYNKTNYTNNRNSNNNTQVENSDVNSNPTIEDIIFDYLYTKIEINEHKYTLIKNISDIYDLKNNRYYISANTCGINSLLIFMKKDGKYYSYLIDRRSMSYNKSALNKSQVRLREINLAVDLKFYDGTIMDGILIENEASRFINKGENVNTNMNFMVTDVFTFCGKSMLSINYKKKMYMINNLLNECIEDKDTNNIILHVSRPYELNQSFNLFQEYISAYNKKYNIKGITFYPEHSGTKLIYIFDKQDEKIKNDMFNGNISKMETTNDKEDNLQLLNPSEKKKVFKFELINPECIDDIVLNLEMKKTNISDVYKLYAIFSLNNKFIKKKIGIAYIPTYSLSLKCKKYFNDCDVKIMRCIFNPNKGKWVPLDEATIQKIDIINNEKRLKMYEEEIVEQDNNIDENS